MLGVVILGKALRVNQWAALTILVAVRRTGLEPQTSRPPQASNPRLATQSSNHRRADQNPRPPNPRLADPRRAEQKGARQVLFCCSHVLPRLGQGVVMAQGGTYYVLTMYLL